MMRTPEEERIFHALSQIQTPAWDLSGVVEQAGGRRRARLRPGRPLAAAAAHGARARGARPGSPGPGRRQRRSSCVAARLCVRVLLLVNPPRGEDQ